jgi:hypothetical protein
MSDRWIKDPDETLQYKFDWAPLANGTGDSNWLDRTSSPVEYISSQTTVCTDSPSVTIDSSEIILSSTAVAVKISGGTIGSRYRIRNRITTSTGQIRDKTATLIIMSR